MLSGAQLAADSVVASRSPSRADGMSSTQRSETVAAPASVNYSSLPPPNVTLFMARFKNIDSLLAMDYGHNRDSNDGNNNNKNNINNNNSDDNSNSFESAARSISVSMDGVHGTASRARREEHNAASSDIVELKDAGASSTDNGEETALWEVKHTVTYPTSSAQHLRQQLLSELGQLKRQLGNHAGDLCRAVEERIQPLRHVSYFDALAQQKRDVESSASGEELSELSLDVPLSFPCLGGHELDVKQLILEAVQSIWSPQPTQGKDSRFNSSCDSDGTLLDSIPANRRTSRHRNEEASLFWALTNSMASLHILQDIVWYFYLEFFALAELDERFELHRLRALTEVLEKEVIHAQRMRNNALLAHTRGRHDNPLASAPADSPDTDAHSPSPVNYTQLQQLAATAEKRIATMQQYSNFMVQPPQPLAYGPLHLRTTSEAHNVSVADPKTAPRRQRRMSTTQPERIMNEKWSNRNSTGTGGVLALLHILANGAGGGGGGPPALDTMRTATPPPYDTASDKDLRMSDTTSEPVEGMSGGQLEKLSWIDHDVLGVYCPEALDAGVRYDDFVDDSRRSRSSRANFDESANAKYTGAQDGTQRNAGQALRDALFVSLPLEPDLLVAGEVNLRRAIDVIAFSEGFRPDWEQTPPLSSSMKGISPDESCNSAGSSLYCRRNVERILAESENSRSGLRSCIIAAHASRVVRLAQKRVFRRLSRNFTLLLLSLVQVQEKQQISKAKVSERSSTGTLPSVSAASSANQTKRSGSAQSNEQSSSDYAVHKTCDLATLLCAHAATVWTVVAIQILSVAMPFTKDLWTTALVQHMMRRVSYWVQGVENDNISEINLDDLVYRASRCLTRISSPASETAERPEDSVHDTSPNITSQGTSPSMQPSSRMEPELCLSSGALSPMPLSQNIPPAQASHTQPPSPTGQRNAEPTSPDPVHTNKNRQKNSSPERGAGHRSERRRPNAYYTAAYKDIVAIFERIVHSQQSSNEDNNKLQTRAVPQLSRFHTTSSRRTPSNHHSSSTSSSRSPSRRGNRKHGNKATRKSSRSPRSVEHSPQLPNLSLPPSATQRLPWNESGKRANTIAVRRGNARNSGGGLSGILRSLIASGVQLPTSSTAATTTSESSYEADGIAQVMATLLPEFTRVVVGDQLARSGNGQTGSGMVSSVSSTHRSATAAAPGYAFLTYINEDERSLAETRKATAQQANRPQQQQQVQREYFDLASVSPLLHSFMKDESIPLPHSAVRVFTSQAKMGLMRWS